MVTAGVYLVCRMHVIFDLAPDVRLAVGVIGAVTLLISGLSALVQSDIKRVLAYSTISQIGYMFLAMGAGAYSAAVFHFITHAFFKSLLFLAAGVVIIALGREHDIFKMGGLRDSLPVAFWTFLAGAASLAALPLITAGFYSKEMILGGVWASGPAGRWLWGAGLVGAFLTALYAFRVVFVVFFGEEKSRPGYRPGFRLQAPLVVLAGLSLGAGFIQVPQTLGRTSVLSNFLRPVFGSWSAAAESPRLEFGLEIASVVAVLAGLCLAYLLYGKPGRPGTANRGMEGTPRGRVHRFLFGGFGFDGLYGLVFVKPFLWAARANRGDFIDLLFRGVAALGRVLSGLVSLLQTGRLRWYAAGLAIGAIIVFAVVVFL